MDSHFESDIAKKQLLQLSIPLPELLPPPEPSTPADRSDQTPAPKDELPPVVQLPPAQPRPLLTK
ncbi:21703_t:CDS:2, partial [Racocetra persica]